MPSSIRRPCYGSGFRVKGSLTGSTRVSLGFQPEHGILRLKTLNPTYTVVGGEGVPESLEPFCIPLVSREWRNGSNSSYNCTPFLHSLLTKGKFRDSGYPVVFAISCRV